MKPIIGILVGAGLALFAAPAFAQQLVYTPVNPSFGGNPFNSSHLLGLAGAQNLYRANKVPTAELTQDELFAQQLQSQLLSGLASRVTEAIFGENPQQSGTISFGGQTVAFVRDLENVTVTITNALGAQTVIKVPNFGQVR